MGTHPTTLIETCGVIKIGNVIRKVKKKEKESR
jgi:hypothetical protein